MNRKEFIAQVGLGAAALLVPLCLSGLAGCKPEENTPPSNVDFTLDVSSGALATNGGFLVSNSIIVARTNAGFFIAVSAACPHQGTTVNYNAADNNFVCPNHGAQFSSLGSVTQGPAESALKQYNTDLNGTSLRVFS